MAYTVQPVLMPNTIDNVQIVGLGGFPATFNCFLLSFWACLGSLPRVLNFSNSVPWGSISISSSGVGVQLRPAVSMSYFFNGQFNVAIGNYLSHILVSVSPAANTVQVYVNDVAISLSTGGPGTPATGFNVTGPGAGWEVLASGSAAPGAGVGDLFAAPTSSLFDLTNVANRRKFINSDLTPVDLGSNAASVLGAAPPIYLTVRPGSANPNDFATNNGTGGTWTISAPPLVFETSLGCVPPPPPPVINKLALDNVIATAQATLLPKNLVSLRWSDDRGHSWGHPVAIPMGEAGEYRTSLQWQRLAYARDRVFEIYWDVPCRTALQGCWIDVTPAQS